MRQCCNRHLLNVLQLLPGLDELALALGLVRPG